MTLRTYVALLAVVSTALILPLAGFAQNPQDQDDVLRVTTELVVLNVTVLDKNGKFIPGLKSSDFQILEDGQPQKASTFAAEETPFAAAILLDTSGSMENRLTLGRSAAIRFLDGLRDEDVAAVYSFDSKVEQWHDFSPGRGLAPKGFGLKTKLMTSPKDLVADISRLRADSNCVTPSPLSPKS